MSKYYIKARLYPSLITIVPLLILYYFTLGSEINKSVGEIIGLPIMIHLSISASLLYGITLLNRFIAKEIFQRFYFKEEINMPTTNLLLHKNGKLSRNMKEKIREKINRDFQINLMSTQDEENDEMEGRKQIVFAVSQIRNATRNNDLLLQHNIEYGFVRNLIGGSFIALLICLINVYIFIKLIPIVVAVKLTLTALIIYLLIISLSKLLMHRLGNNYAKVLFEQFMSSR